jgi:hypothetical protein
MVRARRALDLALRAAAHAGVAAAGEILEGSPRKRILEFARDRGARLVVVGRRRRRSDAAFPAPLCEPPNDRSSSPRCGRVHLSAMRPSPTASASVTKCTTRLGL